MGAPERPEWLWDDDRSIYRMFPNTCDELREYVEHLEAVEADKQEYVEVLEGDVFRLKQERDKAEAEKERLARVAEDYIASLDRCTERKLCLENEMIAVRAVLCHACRYEGDPLGDCSACVLGDGFVSKFPRPPEEPKADEDTDPDGRATGEVLDEPQVITEADAAAGLEKMFEEPMCEFCGVRHGPLTACSQTGKPPEEPREGE